MARPDELRSDDRVRVTAGPFAGYEGRIVSSVDARRSGLLPRPVALDDNIHLVMVTIADKEVPLHIPCHHLERR
jgi:transcription antitermination factor NusG